MNKSTLIKSTILLTILLTIFSQIAIAADAPIWTYAGAKWYSMMEAGNLMVGTGTGITMLDGATVERGTVSTVTVRKYFSEPEMTVKTKKLLTQ